MAMHYAPQSPDQPATGETPAPATTPPAAPGPRRRRLVPRVLQHQQSDAFFRALSEHATDLVLILEANGTIRYASPSHRRLLGYTPEAMEDHNAAEFIHPADLPAVQARTVATARKRDAVETMIFRIRHADGSWRTLEAIGANRLRDPVIRGWVVNSRDITERLRLDKALRDSEQRYHTVVDAVPQLLWTLTPPGEVDFVNRWGRDYLGLTLADLEGMKLLQVIHPDDRARYQDVRTQALAARSALHAEIRLRRHDGSYRWHLIQIVPLRDDDGRVLAWYSAATEIDALKRAEEERGQLLARAQAAQAAAEAAHRQLKSTLEDVSDAFVALDTEWRYTYVNQQAGQLFGRRPEDLIGKHIWTVFPEGIDQPFYHAYYRAVAEQTPLELEDYYAPWDRWFENRIYPSPNGLSIFFHEITDRKRAEQALAAAEAELRQSEGRLRGLIDGSSAMICLEDLDGRYVLVNQAVERFFGRERAAIEGQSSYDLLPEMAEARRAQDRLVIERNAEVSIEEQLCRDGELHTYHLQKFPIHDGHGAVCAIGDIATDITARAQVDAALQERERQLAAAQRVAHIGSFEWDALADRVSWSDELYRIYGLEPQSFGATFDAFIARIHPEDRARVRDTIGRAIAEGGAFRMHERIIRPGGEIRHLSSWGEVECDAQGRPLRLLGICQDVTDQRRQEEALRASEERFRRLVDANIIGVFIARFDGAITDANDAFLRMVGYTREDVAAGALRWDAITLPAYRERDDQALRDLRAAGICAAYEKVFMGKDGRQVPVLIGAAVLEASHDTCIAFALDLTPRKRAEDAVRRLNETLEQQVEERTAQLREANEELEAFSYSVSHDLRAPLRAMQGFAAALLEDYADRLDTDGQEYARRIDVAAARMDLLIADLLAYSRLSRTAIAVQPVALDAAVASALAQVGEDLRQRGAHVQIAPRLPRVVAHHATLVQVVANLLTNAAKFVAGDLRPEIAVWAEERGKWTRLWVSDNGIGIAPEHRERIFAVFERLHGVEMYPGTGIGLAIVRKGMERLGGRVGLESTVGRGSRFWIELPAAREEKA